MIKRRKSMSYSKTYYQPASQPVPQTLYQDQYQAPYQAPYQAQAQNPAPAPAQPQAGYYYQPQPQQQAQAYPQQDTQSAEARQKDYRVPYEKDYWDCEAKSTFIRLSTLFDGEEKSSKIALSFVKHERQPDGKCKRLDNIVIYLSMTSDGSNGETGAMQQTGICGESLVNLISSGALAQMAYKEQVRAAQAGEQYPGSIFGSIGGSPAKVKNGVEVPVKFRKFTITPMAAGRGGGYMMHAFECDGYKTSTGGYAPLSGTPNKHRIDVPVSEFYMRALAENIRNHWIAYLTACNVKEMMAEK